MRGRQIICHHSISNHGCLRKWKNRPVFSKALNTLSILALLFPSLGWAFSGPEAYPKAAVVRFDGKTLEIPVTEARLVGASGGRGRFVLLIQDLHCNHEVQRRVAGLIGLMAEKFNVSLVAIEGASAYVNVTHLATYPDPAVREMVADEFLRQGRISGPEYYAGCGNKPVNLVGLENERLYNTSHDAVMEFVNAENQGYVEDLEEQLGELKTTIYSQKLLEFDAAGKAYRDGKQPLLQYCATLCGWAQQQGVALNAFPDAAGYASQAANAVPREVDPNRIVKDCKALDRAIRESLYGSDSQRTLDEQLRRLEAIRTLLSVSATPEEVREFRAHPENYVVRAFVDYIDQESIETGAQSEIDDGVYNLDKYLDKVREFYNLADQRSDVFVGNLARRMAEKQAKIAVAVAGGFHSERMMQALAAEGIGYVCVSPRLTRHDIANPYFSLLRKRQTPLEKLVAENQDTIALRPFFPQSEQPGALVPWDQERRLPVEIRTFLDLLRLAFLEAQLLTNVAAGVGTLPELQTRQQVDYPYGDRIGLDWDQALMARGEVLVPAQGLPLSLLVRPLGKASAWMAPKLARLENPNGSHELMVLDSTQAAGEHARLTQPLKVGQSRGQERSPAWFAMATGPFVIAAAAQPQQTAIILLRSMADGPAFRQWMQAVAQVGSAVRSSNQAPQIMHRMLGKALVAVLAAALAGRLPSAAFADRMMETVMQQQEVQSLPMPTAMQAEVSSRVLQMAAKAQKDFPRHADRLERLVDLVQTPVALLAASADPSRQDHEIDELGMFHWHAKMYLLQSAYLRLAANPQELAAVVFHQALKMVGFPQAEANRVLKQSTSTASFAGYEPGYLAQRAGWNVQRATTQEGREVMAACAVHTNAYQGGGSDGTRALHGQTLSPERLRQWGMEPRYKTTVEGKTVYFSKAFQGANYNAVVAYLWMEETRQWVARTYYLSNSQGVWRYLPAVLYRRQAMAWLHKGFGEDSIAMPYEGQAALNEVYRQTLAAGGLDHGLSADIREFLFAGTSRTFTDDGTGPTKQVVFDAGTYKRLVQPNGDFFLGPLDEAADLHMAVQDVEDRHRNQPKTFVQGEDQKRYYEDASGLVYCYQGEWAQVAWPEFREKRTLLELVRREYLDPRHPSEANVREYWRLRDGRVVVFEGEIRKLRGPARRREEDYAAEKRFAGEVSGVKLYRDAAGREYAYDGSWRVQQFQPLPNPRTLMQFVSRVEDPSGTVREIWRNREGDEMVFQGTVGVQVSVRPEEMAIPTAEDQPDFGAILAEFPMQNTLAEGGRVVARVFPSVNKKYRYLFLLVARGRSWIASIEVAGSANAVALHPRWVKSMLATPMYEYTMQTRGLGDWRDRNGHYVGMWKNCLSRMPVHQAYRNRFVLQPLKEKLLREGITLALLQARIVTANGSRTLDGVAVSDQDIQELMAAVLGQRLRGQVTAVEAGEYLACVQAGAPSTLAHDKIVKLQTELAGQPNAVLERAVALGGFLFGEQGRGTLRRLLAKAFSGVGVLVQGVADGVIHRVFEMSGSEAVRLGEYSSSTQAGQARLAAVQRVLKQQVDRAKLRFFPERDKFMLLHGVQADTALDKVKVVRHLPRGAAMDPDLERLGVFNYRGTVYILEQTLKKLDNDQLTAVLLHELLEVQGASHETAAELVQAASGMDNDVLEAAVAGMALRGVQAAEAAEILRDTDIHNNPYPGTVHGRKLGWTQLTPEDLRDAGLQPAHKLTVAGQVIYFSPVFSVNHEREAVIAYVKDRGRWVARTYYLSNSQGFWRYLPYAQVENGEVSWFHKGWGDYGEDSLTLPFPVQKALNEIRTKPQVAIDHPWRFDMLFAGTTRVFETFAEMQQVEGYGTYNKDISPDPLRLYSDALNQKMAAQPDTAKDPDDAEDRSKLIWDDPTNHVQIFQSRNGKFNYSYVDGAHYRTDPVIKPEEIQVADPGNQPDFRQVIDTFQVHTSLRAKPVTVRICQSANRQLNYIFMEDDQGRVWIGGIERAEIPGRLGLRINWIMGEGLCTPAYEYSQMSAGFGNPADRVHGYVDVWDKYLSKIKIHQDYRKAFILPQAARQLLRDGWDAEKLLGYILAGAADTHLGPVAARFHLGAADWRFIWREMLRLDAASKVTRAGLSVEDLDKHLAGQALSGAPARAVAALTAFGFEAGDFQALRGRLVQEAPEQFQAALRQESVTTQEMQDYVAIQEQLQAEGGLPWRGAFNAGRLALIESLPARFGIGLGHQKGWFAPQPSFLLGGRMQPIFERMWANARAVTQTGAALADFSVGTFTRLLEQQAYRGLALGAYEQSQAVDEPREAAVRARLKAFLANARKGAAAEVAEKLGRLDPDRQEIVVLQKIPASLARDSDLEQIGVFNYNGRVYILQSAFERLADDPQLAAVILHEMLEIAGLTHEQSVATVAAATGYANETLIAAAGLSETAIVPYQSQTGPKIEEITEEEAVRLQQQGVETIQPTRVEEPETALEVYRPEAALRLRARVLDYARATRSKFLEQPQVLAAVRAIENGGPIVVMVVQHPIAAVQHLMGRFFVPRISGGMGVPGRRFEDLERLNATAPAFFFELLRSHGVPTSQAAAVVKSIANVDMADVAQKTGVRPVDWEASGTKIPDDSTAIVPASLSTAPATPVEGTPSLGFEFEPSDSWSANRPVRIQLPASATATQYAVRTLLFAGNHSQAGNLNMWLPWEATGPVMMAASGMIRSAAWAYTAGKTVSGVDDLTPRFAAFKRALTLPDQAAARWFDIKQIRFQPLSQYGSVWERFAASALFGAYREGGSAANHGEYATVYIPDSLLQAAADEGSVPADGTLRNAFKRLDHRMKLFLFCCMAAQQSRQYYDALRANPLGQFLSGEERVRFEEPQEIEYGLSTLQEGEPAQTWYQSKRDAVALNPAEIAGLAAVYLREADALLGETRPHGREDEAARVQQSLRDGGVPALTTVIDTMAAFRSPEAGSEAAWYKSLARECQKLRPDSRKLVANSMVGLFVRRTLAVGNARRKAEPGIAQVKQVRLLAMPDTSRQLITAIEAARGKLKGKPEAQGLLERLELLHKALQAVESSSTGTLVALDSSVGLPLMAELARFHQENMAEVMPLGADVDRDIHAACTGRVKTAEIEGFAMADCLVYEVSVPARTAISVADLSRPRLPSYALARRYNGEMIPRVRTPFAVGPVGQAALYTLLRVWPLRANHVRVAQLAPMAYLGWMLEGLDSRLSDVLRDSESPLGQAYLRYAQNPGNQKLEREFVKAMLRMLKAEASAAKEAAAAGDRSARQAIALKHQRSMAAFSELAHRMDALDAVALGEWERSPEGTRVKKVYAPMILMIQNSRGAMGMYYDLLSDMPVKVDTEELERKRREHFQDASVAA